MLCPVLDGVPIPGWRLGELRLEVLIAEFILCPGNLLDAEEVRDQPEAVLLRVKNALTTFSSESRTNPEMTLIGDGRALNYRSRSTRRVTGPVDWLAARVDLVPPAVRATVRAATRSWYCPTEPIGGWPWRGRRHRRRHHGRLRAADVAWCRRAHGHPTGGSIHELTVDARRAALTRPARPSTGSPQCNGSHAARFKGSGLTRRSPDQRMGPWTLPVAQFTW
jgi:hypothetical protein